MQLSDRDGMLERSSSRYKSHTIMDDISPDAYCKDGCEQTSVPRRKPINTWCKKCGRLTNFVCNQSQGMRKDQYQETRWLLPVYNSTGASRARSMTLDCLPSGSKALIIFLHVVFPYPHAPVTLTRPQAKDCSSLEELQLKHPTSTYRKRPDFRITHSSPSIPFFIPSCTPRD